ncbi:MAG: radical SAM family heme chaperone HemW [Armatimonadaceae bacterium]
MKSELLQREWHPTRISPAAAYVHIPFCAKKCGYCDFNAYSGYKDGTKSRYVDAICHEIATRGAGGQPLTSVFFGGGTPTQLPTAALVRILDTLRETPGIAPNAEVTLEANPNDVMLHDWSALKNAGINRVSFGVQSFNPDVLKMIDRTHAPEDAATAIDTVRNAGISNLSIDLMFGLPRQTLADWRRTLSHAFALEIPHLSIYGLILEEHTPFWGRLQRGRMVLPGDVAQAAMLELAMDLSRDAGYTRYELSNYAMNGLESRHNRVYWRNDAYWGFGAGAVGYNNVERTTNVMRPSRYIDAMLSGAPMTFEMSESPDLAGSIGETMMLGLRLPEGVTLSDVSARYGVDIRELYADELTSGVETGLLEVVDDVVRLTKHGTMFANDAMLLFIA